MKKVISLILTVLMLFPMFSTAISAEELKLPKLNIESVEANPGETINVDVTLENNPGIVSANLKVAFDEGLTLVGATNGDVFATLTYIPPKQLSSGGQVTSDCQFVWTGFDIEDKDIKNGKVLTLKFKVSDDVEIGEALNVSIKTENGDVIDKNLNSVILSAQSIVKISEKIEAVPLFITSATGSPGETVVVDVSLTNNPGIVSANLKVAFDEGLTLVGATNGDVFSTLTYIPPKQLSSSGVITSSCQFAWTGFDIEDKDIKNGTILSLKFNIPAEAEIGDIYYVTISSKSGDVIDKNLNSIILNAKSIIEVVQTEKPCAHVGGTATCNAKAKCTECGEEYGSLNANNHKSLTTIKAVPATCTKTGLSEGKKCTDCGAVTVAQKTVAKKAHSLTTLKAVAATYKTAGKTEGKKCIVCGTVTVAQKTVAKKVLGKVTGLKTKTVKLASGTKTTLTLAWTKVADAQKYEVYQQSGKKWKKIGTTSKTTLTVKKLKANKSYKFKVRAIRSDAKGAYSSVFTGKTVPLTPAVTLKAGKKALTASWKTVANITGYEVQASTSKKFTSKTTKKVSITKVKTTKTTIKKLSKGKKYYVKVRAYKTVGKTKIYSAWSSVKTVKVK